MNINIKRNSGKIVIKFVIKFLTRFAKLDSLNISIQQIRDSSQQLRKLQI